MSVVEMQPIAVVGMACRFPGAADLETFWQNLVAGRESITFWSPEQLAEAGVPAPLREHPDYVAASPVMPEADRFDADLFGMTPHEAQLCDPQLRVFLETCHAAAEHAGYDPFALPDSVGVFGSVGPNRYWSQVLQRRPDLIGPAGMLAQTLNQTDYLATLVAYRLNLRGPALTVQTACSSTLVAVHLACQALRNGECDSALAGGSVLRLPLVRGHLWTPGGVHSADGHCRPFDASASGTIFGSGAGVVLLKRLDDAIAEGDRVAAVILGSAVNNDGAEKLSFSAPSVTGQTAVVMEAMMLAGVRPAEVGYVEAHATGTSLGDPVEVAALTEAFDRLTDEPLPAGSCLLGCVKSNIGHLDAVAGVAGLIKAVLALERETIPATVNLTTPNPLLDLANRPFEVCATRRPWPHDPQRRRVAGVTSLGIGGTNAHAVLSEAPAVHHTSPDGRPRVVVWSARGEDGEARLRDSLGGYLGSLPDERFPDAVATLQYGRTPHPHRAAVVARSAAAAAAALAGQSPTARVVTAVAADEPRVALSFPGQGAQRARMAMGLYGTLRGFTVPMDECIELFEQEGIPLYKQWTESAGNDDLAGPTLAQPLLFSVGYALAELWRHSGVRPVAVLGHSLGELTAAAVAGVFSLPDAVRLVAARASAMAEHPVAGGMLAVAAGLERVADLLTGRLALATVNGARQVVVSGPDAELADLTDRLRDQAIAARRLPVDAAFHHPGWADAADAWAAAFDRVTPQEPEFACYSGAAGGRVDGQALKDTGFWTGQLLRPVRFDAALGSLLADGTDVLLEAGPGPALTDLARKHPDRGAVTCVASIREGRDELAETLTAAARVWAAGVPLNWWALDQPAPMTRVAVPGFPYRRVRHWADPVDVDAPLGQPAPTGLVPATGEAVPVPAGAADPDDPFGGAVTEVAWQESTGPVRPPDAVAPGPALVLLPADPTAAVQALSVLHGAGLRPILVHAGTRYQASGGEYRIRPDRIEDLERVLAAQRDAGALPHTLIHAASLGPDGNRDDAAERAAAWFGSLLAMSRSALGSAVWPAPPRLVLLTSHAVNVSGAEPVDPARSALLGLMRTVRAEAPRMACVALDVDGGADPAVVAGDIRSGRIPLVAVRGRRRWTPVERLLRAPAAPDAPGRALRRRGVYLITGGGGGLGQAVSRALATTGLRPRLVLVGRRDPADTLGEHVQRLRELGAEVRTYACDVTDAAAVAAVLAQVTGEYGPVNGVLHLAGVAGDRMVAFREPADAAAVLAPKTTGTQVIERALAGRPGLDFIVYFSSRAAVDGLVGGGDYAAANAFLDGAAQNPALPGVPVLSVGWPVWHGAGMAARTAVDIGRLNRTVRQLTGPTGGQPGTGPETAAPDPLVWAGDLGPATHWVLDEHRVGRVPLLPGTGYLDLIVTAYRELVAGGGAAVEITDAVFRAPWLDQRPRSMRLEFRQAQGGHTVEVRSRPADPQRADEPAVLHVTCRIQALPEAPRPRVEIAGLRDRFDAAGRAVRSGPARGGRMFVLGPRWHNMAGAWELPGEKLVRLELPAVYHAELAGHALYPALLDTATAAVRRAGQPATVPFVYRRLTVLASLPARFYAHVRTDPAAAADTPTGDIDLIADDGELIGRVEGFTMIATDEARLRESGASAVPVTAGSTPEPAQPVSEPAGGQLGGLAPDLGAQLLLGLLDAGVHGAVLVRPFADGQPLPVPPSGQPVPAAPEPTAGPPSHPRTPAPVEPPAVPDAPVPAVGAAADAGRRLREIWLQALGLDDVEPDQDFFDAGGNSLTAVELMARVRDAFGVELSIGLLLEARTFRELHEVLRQRGVE
jgi:acyl transferase domain-containing protein/acyl carrier protein